jgi:hypothetical protein
MEPYKNGEFCKSVNCPIREEWEKSSTDMSELKKICQEKCIKTAYEFHDWLINNGFSIQK